MPKKSKQSKSASEHKQEVLAAIRKEFGNGAAYTIQDRAAAAQITEYIKTGIDVIDNYVSGEGHGLPVGRMSEVFGEEGCGKTSFGYACIASVQRQGGIGVIADAEQSFDEERAKMFGVNVNDLIMLEFDTYEEFYDELKVTVQANKPKHGPMLIVQDSIASMNTKAALEGDAEDMQVAEMARLNSRELKKLPALLGKHRAHLMMLNQVRQKIGVVFGNNTATPGGKAPAFFSSIRLQFWGGKAVKNAAKEHLGKVVTIQAIKNRLAPPFRKARVHLDYTHGWNNVWSTLEYAKEKKLITPRAKGFKGKGRASIEDYQAVLDLLGWDPSNPVVGEWQDAGPGDAADEAEED